MKRLLLVAMLLGGCRTERRAPEDLRGVFDRSAFAVATSASPVPSGAPTGAATSAASGAATSAASASPRVDEATVSRARRAPVKGPCLAPSGEPARVDERPARRPACRGAEILEHGDGATAPRYACVFRPDGIERRAPLPLVVFFHGADETPAKVSRETLLRDLLDDRELSGDAAHRGFIVLAPQARRLERRMTFDARHVSEENPDVRAADRFVEVLEKRGWIDKRRIYAMGAGRGGEMAALYAMLRSDRVAAFASYGGNAASLRWTCEAEAPPAAVVYRACDTVTPCLDVEQWLHAREQARAPTLTLRLGVGNQPEPSCSLDTFRCKKEKGEQNHRRWPRGKEREILDYLGRFSLDLPAP